MNIKIQLIILVSYLLIIILSNNVSFSDTNEFYYNFNAINNIVIDVTVSNHISVIQYKNKNIKSASIINTSTNTQYLSLKINREKELLNSFLISFKFENIHNENNSDNKTIIAEINSLGKILSISSHNDNEIDYNNVVSSLFPDLSNKIPSWNNNVSMAIPEMKFEIITKKYYNSVLSNNRFVISSTSNYSDFLSIESSNPKLDIILNYDNNESCIYDKKSSLPSSYIFNNTYEVLYIDKSKNTPLLSFETRNITNMLYNSIESKQGFDNEN